MSVAKAPKQGVITLVLKDKNMLYASYMPFLRSGGLFVQTTRHFELGDEVFLLLTLMDDPQRHPVTGKVVWITPKASANRPLGIGIHFVGEDAANVQKKIETYLAGALKSDRPTYTL
jgi:type IV pilus assembly protein PilZ